MDPSIMKLLEEDEDETMHSGADVDAFQAALNRDIGGDASTSQPPDSVLPHESNQTAGQQFSTWQTTTQDEILGGGPIQQDGITAKLEQQQEKPATAIQANQQQQNVVQVQQVKMEQATPLHMQTTTMPISETNSMPVSELDKVQHSDNDSHYIKLLKMGNQQTTSVEQSSTSVEQSSGQKNQNRMIPFMALMPFFRPHLDKDKEMQLGTLFVKLKKNEIAKEQFVRHLRDLVGDQVLKMAVSSLQNDPALLQLLIQGRQPVQQNVRMPTNVSTSQFIDSHMFVPHPKGANSPGDPSRNTPARVPTDLSYPSAEYNAHKSQEMEQQQDSHGMPSNACIVNQERERSSISMQGQSKQQQQHLHQPQTSVPMYGGNVANYRPYSGTNVSPSGSSVKPQGSQAHELQMRQVSQHQSMSTTLLGGSTQPMSVTSIPKFERQNSVNDPSRPQSGSISHFPNKAALQQNSVPWQASTTKEQNSTSFSLTNNLKQESADQSSEQQQKPSQLSNLQGLSTAPGEQGNSFLGNVKDAISVSPSIANPLETNVQVGSRMPSAVPAAGRTPPKKPPVGQKKPLEALGSSPPTSSNKKQKVSGAFLDQSIEQLNDVTAVSGVNLREEEEQLFSVPKEDSRVSEASRRVVQEEEERLILQKNPLQKKLVEIMAKCGLKNIGNDVERCLSLCVEERMRGLITNLIRLSKQRVDIEKPRHRTIITSDIQQQIMKMNQKAREEWERKQAEAEKIRKVNEQPEGDSVLEGDKEKDEGRGKTVKANKEEDDKMRTTAANVAARAAVGGDDMLSKWQLMAEQARQKREGGTEAASVSQPAKDVSRKPLSTSGRHTKDNLDTEGKSPVASAASSGSIRKLGRNQVIVPQARVARTISVKDVIAVLEREPQMSRSTLIYRLYERIRSNAAAE